MGVEYCPICGLPFEYCKFGPSAKNCRENLRIIRPHLFARLYPDVVPEQAEHKEEEPVNTNEGEENAQVEAPSVESGESEYDGSEESSEEEYEEELEPAHIAIDLSGKGKGKRPATLVLRMRGKKKVTEAQYLQLWGLSLDEVSKDLRKTCQAAVAVVEDVNLGKDYSTIIRIQGDFRAQIRSYLIQHGIPENQIADGGTTTLRKQKRPKPQDKTHDRTRQTTPAGGQNQRPGQGSGQQQGQQRKGGQAGGPQGRDGGQRQAPRGRPR